MVTCLVSHTWWKSYLIPAPCYKAYNSGKCDHLPRHLASFNWNWNFAWSFPWECCLGLWNGSCIHNEWRAPLHTFYVHVPSWRYPSFVWKYALFECLWWQHWGQFWAWTISLLLYFLWIIRLCYAYADHSWSRHSNHWGFWRHLWDFGRVPCVVSEGTNPHGGTFLLDLFRSHTSPFLSRFLVHPTIIIWLINPRLWDTQRNRLLGPHRRLCGRNGFRTYS